MYIVTGHGMMSHACTGRETGIALENVIVCNGLTPGVLYGGEVHCIRRQMKVV